MSSDIAHRALLDGLVVPVYATDAQGRITFYNAAAADLWGRRPRIGRGLGGGSWRIFHLDGTPMSHATCPMAVALAENRPVRGVEILVERPDGSRIAVLPHPTPLRDVSGTLIGAVNLLVDVTHRKRAEAALRDSEARFQLIADRAPAMIWMSGKDSRTRYVGKGLLDFVGSTLEAEEGRPLGYHVHSGDQEAYARAYALAFENREAFELEYRLRRNDGVYRWVLDHAAPITNADGSFDGYLSSLLDVTDRHEAWDRLREAAALRDQFVSLVSHELRTPIATVLGNALLLQRHDSRLTEADRRQALADVVTEADRLREIIENLLLLTRLDATAAVEGQPFAGGPVIRAEIARFKRLRPERKVVFHADPNAPPMFGQEALVALVIWNLLGNADKYSAPQHPITIRLGHNHTGVAEVRVMDRGIGIDGADRYRVFEAYFRTDGGRNQGKGMGLGLAVCKRAIEAQGGAIGVRPRRGGGSDFSFSLAGAGRGGSPP